MAITTANNSSNSHHSRRPCRNRRRTTSTGSSDSGRSYLALKLFAIIGILCCAVRNVLSPTTMNLKQWTMLVSPIITAPPPPTTTITKIEELTKELEEGLIADVYRQVEDKEETTGTSASASATRTKNLQYYVYDDIVMRMPEIRDKARVNSQPWIWKPKWGRRFADYARGEIRWIEALEQHPLRTTNASEAAFFVVPIPVSATYFWDYHGPPPPPQQGDDPPHAAHPASYSKAMAFRYLFNHTLFRRFPERHVAFAITEKLFVTYWGLSHKELIQFQPMTIVRDSDSDNWRSRLKENHKTWDNKLPGAKNKVFHHTVSLGYGGEGCNPRNTYKEVTLEGWKTKTFWIFYHSREEVSVSNSTIFRHALLPSSFILEREREQQREQQKKQNSTTTPSSSSVVVSLPERFQHQPVSIGYDLPPDQWIQEYSNSRFCLVIRGDQPGSTSLFRSIRMGCLPIVVSDSLPGFQQLYHHVLQYDDFSVTVSEDDFLMNPIQSLDDAILFLLSDPVALQTKMNGLRLMQRIITCDQPDSLFVPAFAKEIVLTQQMD